jgi:hypothetical protein
MAKDVVDGTEGGRECFLLASTGKVQPAFISRVCPDIEWPTEDTVRERIKSASELNFLRLSKRPQVRFVRPITSSSMFHIYRYVKTGIAGAVG